MKGVILVMIFLGFDFVLSFSWKYLYFKSGSILPNSIEISVALVTICALQTNKTENGNAFCYNKKKKLCKYLESYADEEDLVNITGDGFDADWPCYSECQHITPI